MSESPAQGRAVYTWSPYSALAHSGEESTPATIGLAHLERARPDCDGIPTYFAHGLAPVHVCAYSATAAPGARMTSRLSALGERAHTAPDALSDSDRDADADITSWRQSSRRLLLTQNTSASLAGRGHHTGECTASGTDPQSSALHAFRTSAVHLIRTSSAPVVYRYTQRPASPSVRTFTHSAAAGLLHLASLYLHLHLVTRAHSSSRVSSRE